MAIVRKGLISGGLAKMVQQEIDRIFAEARAAARALGFKVTKSKDTGVHGQPVDPGLYEALELEAQFFAGVYDCESCWAYGKKGYQQDYDCLVSDPALHARSMVVNASCDLWNEFLGDEGGLLMVLERIDKPIAAIRRYMPLARRERDAIYDRWLDGCIEIHGVGSLFHVEELAVSPKVTLVPPPMAAAAA